MTKPEDIWWGLYDGGHARVVSESEEHPAMVMITEEELVSLLKQYGDERAWEAREILIAQHDVIPCDHVVNSCEICQLIDSAKNAARLAASEELAVWHDEQAAGWQEQATMSHRMTQEGDETETSDYFVQFERYTKYRSLHQNSAASIRGRTIDGSRTQTTLS